MGQYYRALVIDAAYDYKVLEPWAFPSETKLMEHAWIGNQFVNAVYSLIHNNPCEVAWIGDDSDKPYDPDADAYAKAMPRRNFCETYDIVWGNQLWESQRVDLTQPGEFSEAQFSLVDHETSDMYLINHSRKCYLELGAYIQCSTVKDGSPEGRCLNPLPLLTACGNGRGEGDFREGNVGYEDVGIWAFDELEYSDKLPKGYTKKHFRFIEHQ